MPSRKFKIEKNQEKTCLEICWTFFWKNIEIKVNNITVHKIGSKKELDKGVTFNHQGDKIFVQLRPVMMSPQIIVEVNDSPLPGSSNDPTTMVRNGYYLMYFLMGLNLVVGLAATIGHFTFLNNLGFGLYNLLVALVYFVSYYISRNYNLLAGLIGCFLFYILDGVVAIVWVIRTSPHSVSGTVISRLIFGTVLFLACKGAYKLQGKVVSHADVSMK